MVPIRKNVSFGDVDLVSSFRVAIIPKSCEFLQFGGLDVISFAYSLLKLPYNLP